MKEKGREVKKKTRNGVTKKERKNKRRMMRKIKLRIKEKRKEEEGQDVEDKEEVAGLNPALVCMFCGFSSHIYQRSVVKECVLLIGAQSVTVC